MNRRRITPKFARRLRKWLAKRSTKRLVTKHDRMASEPDKTAEWWHWGPCRTLASALHDYFGRPARIYVTGYPRPHGYEPDGGHAIVEYRGVFLDDHGKLWTKDEAQTHWQNTFHRARQNTYERTGIHANASAIRALTKALREEFGEWKGCKRT